MILTSVDLHWESHGGAWYGGRLLSSPLVENMGLVIRPNLHRNCEGVLGWGGKLYFNDVAN